MRRVPGWLCLLLFTTRPHIRRLTPRCTVSALLNYTASRQSMCNLASVGRGKKTNQIRGRYSNPFWLGRSACRKKSPDKDDSPTVKDPQPLSLRMTLLSRCAFRSVHYAAISTCGVWDLACSTRGRARIQLNLGSASQLGRCTSEKTPPGMAGVFFQCCIRY